MCRHPLVSKMHFRNVLVCGATGQLGTYITNGLLDSSDDFNVSILVREVGLQVPIARPSQGSVLLVCCLEKLRVAIASPVHAQLIVSVFLAGSLETGCRDCLAVQGCKGGVCA